MSDIIWICEHLHENEILGEEPKESDRCGIVTKYIAYEEYEFLKSGAEHKLMQEQLENHKKAFQDIKQKILEIAVRETKAVAALHKITEDPRAFAYDIARDALVEIMALRDKAP